MACAFFNSDDEEYRVLLPFIKEGFEYGDKAVPHPGVWICSGANRPRCGLTGSWSSWTNARAAS